MDALFELPAPATRELELRRACQVALLRDQLLTAGAQEFLPDWLEALNLADLSRHATPFFWLNVARCHAACANAGAGLGVALRCLLMTGFDAFFPVVPDGFSCRLPASDDSVLVLPRLGIRLPIATGPVRLCRAAPSVLRVEDRAGQTTVSLDRIPADDCRVSLPVGSAGSSRLLLHLHPALVPDHVAMDVPVGPDKGAEQAALITAALRLIGEVDPRRGEQLEARSQWYATSLSPGLEIDPTRSVRDLRGLMFLPAGSSRLRLAEALVQEYYQDLLHTRMELEKLLNFDDVPRFYSPWRNDPLPLAGLLHALYVLTGVAEFLLLAEATTGLSEEHGLLRDRRRLLVEQLRLGYAQVRLEHFTLAGQRLLTGLRAVIDRHERELNLPGDRLPEALVAHLRQWCAGHLHLAVAVRRPLRSRP